MESYHWETSSVLVRTWLKVPNKRRSEKKWQPVLRKLYRYHITMTANATTTKHYIYIWIDWKLCDEVRSVIAFWVGGSADGI